MAPYRTLNQWMVWFLSSLPSFDPQLIVGLLLVPSCCGVRTIP